MDEDVVVGTTRRLVSVADGEKPKVIMFTAVPEAAAGEDV